MSETPETVETVETPAETVETETVTAETEEKYDASQLDEFGTMAIARATANIERLNSVHAELKANSSDPAEIQKGIYEALCLGTVPDGVTVDQKVMDQYNKARQIVEAVTAQFDTLADTVAKQRAAESTDTEKVTALEAEADNLTKRIREARKLIAIEYPGAETLLPNVTRGSGAGTSTGSGRGAGGKKLRGFTVSVDGKEATLPNSDGKQVSSFSAGAKALGIPTADLQRAYFAAIDATPDNYQDKVAELTGPVSLKVSGSDNAEHDVTITRNAE